MLLACVRRSAPLPLTCRRLVLMHPPPFSPLPPRHGATGTLCMAALTITLYLTATTLSVRWVWANL